MRQGSYFVFLLLALLPACASTGSDRPGGSASAQQNFGGTVSIGGNNTNTAQGGNVGPITTGAASTSVPVNLALDPSSFSSIFGAARAVTSPAKEQVQQVQQQAAASGDSATVSAASSCLLNLSKCTVTIK